MESRVGYTIVGGFLLLIIAISAYFVVWYKKTSENVVYKYYRINTTESVAGLEVGAVVKYMGVTVGKVNNIFINPNNPQEITIIIQVTDNTPVKKDSLAQLSAQGITGLLYVDIFPGTKDAPLLETTHQPEVSKMGAIRTKRTFFSKLDENLSALVKRLDETLIIAQDLLLKSGKVLSKENTENIEKTLKAISIASQNASELTANLKETEKKFSSFIDTGTTSMKNLDNLSTAAYRVVSTDGAKAIKNINEASTRLNELLKNMNEKVGESNFNLKEILEPTTQQLNNSMQELNILIKQLQENPSDLFFKRTEERLGPGEQR